MCFVFISEQTANSAPYNTDCLVLITEIKTVYCAVWTGSLNKAVCASSLNSAPYNIDCLVFITEIKSVYCAVRTGYLNKAVCASSLKV
jgi:hypothetical protein